MSKEWTAKKVEQIMLLAQGEVSLDTPIIFENEDGCEDELYRFIEDPGPGPQELAERKETREVLLSYIDRYLKPREAEIIKMRFGFETESPMTLAEVGNSFGLTRERVRQIEERALRKLRVRFAKSKMTREDI